MKKIKKSICASIIFILSFSLAFANNHIENANYLAKKWIINDNSRNTDWYRLYDNILRQEAAVITLAAYWKQKQDSCENIFKDVSSRKPNSWACLTIEALAKNKIITTSNSTFRPEDRITKAEVLGMLIKAWFDSEYSFDSKNASTKWNWQKQVVDFAASKWLIINFADYDSPANRAFVFEVWANILKYKAWESFSASTSFGEIKTFYKTNSDVTESQALNVKNIILRETWVNENQINSLVINTSYMNWKMFYNVTFFISWTWLKYTYKIDSTNDSVTDSDIDYEL